MKFNILLQQQNIDILEQELIKRTNPYSEHYGQWFSQDKIESIKNKIRLEAKTAISKDVYINPEDAKIINKFLDKIKSDLKQNN